jgi:protein gp37
MGYPTGIQWTDSSWNPIGGCSIKSPGCRECYAQDLAGTRLINHPLYKGTTDLVKGKPVFNGTMTAVPDGDPRWTWPLKWRGAKNPVMGPGMPSLIFVGDMSDLFHENRPVEQIDKVFAVMALCPQHTFQILTKRPERMRAYLSDPDRGNRVHFIVCGPISDLVSDDISDRANLAMLNNEILPNVWCGASVERQQEADERIPLLLQTPSAVRFVSLEPLLGPVDLTISRTDRYPLGLNVLRKNADGTKLDWVIAGGESGPSARPMHPDWARSLRDQCAAAGVPFFFKQWGEFVPSSEQQWIDDDGSHRHMLVAPDGRHGDTVADLVTQPKGTAWTRRVGKNAAGRLLDGVEHNAMPEIIA